MRQNFDGHQPDVINYSVATTSGSINNQVLKLVSVLMSGVVFGGGKNKYVANRKISIVFLLLVNYYLMMFL